MKLSLSPALVKQSLAGHSWIGLLIGVPMYLICLSGTLAIFYEEFERWEQPAVPEFSQYDPAVMGETFNELLADDTFRTPHMYLVTPTDTIPRVAVYNERGEGWFLNRDGSPGPAIEHNWTEMLVNLHLYLHLPSGWGMIVVSAFGALLCGLIISGFLAHPGIFREAFSWRSGRSRRLEQVDIHNRLSVWGAPFHLLIAVTGAYFGLVLPIMDVIADTTGRESTEVVETIFGEEPRLDQNRETLAVDRAFDEFGTVAPDAQPLFLMVHDAGTPAQFMEIFGHYPDRLIYSENYRFDPDGNYLGKAGYSDGELGQQATYSVYRPHFGHFGGFWVKILYTVLGLALTVVSVTGINIWLARRKKRDALNDLWPAVVWGTPAVLPLTLFTQVIVGIPSTAIFWGGLIAAMLYGLKVRNEAVIKRRLQGTCALLLLVFLAAYVISHGEAAFAPAAIGVNAGLLAVACAMGWLAWKPGAADTRALSRSAAESPQTL